jgi:hypothetical protein
VKPSSLDLRALVLRCYPPSFRARYGLELAALVTDLGPRASTGDLLAGAARAWVRPRFAGPDAPRRRLQATVGTVWVAVCLGGLIVPMATRSLLDPPVAGAGATVRGLLTAATVLLAVAWGLAVAGALPLLLRAVLPAVRSRQWRTLRPLAPALSLAAVVAVGAVTLAAVRGPGYASGPAVALVITWLGTLGALVLATAAGPPIVLDRLAPDRRTLTVPVVAAAGVAITLAGAAACSVAALTVAGSAAVLGTGALVAPIAAVLTVPVLVALVSAGRGVRSLVRP